MSEVTLKSYFVSALGGVADIVSHDGEILASVAIPAGKVRAAPYLELVPEGAELQISEGLAVFEPRSGFGRQAYGEGSHESGANPDYRPTSASRMEREMRLTLSRMQAATSRVEAREKALAQIERMPKAAPVAPAPEAIETPEPKAAPAPAEKPAEAPQAAPATSAPADGE